MLKQPAWQFELAKNAFAKTKEAPSTTNPPPLNARGNIASLKRWVFQQHWPTPDGRGQRS
jgi:hypothetical protein